MTDQAGIRDKAIATAGLACALAGIGYILLRAFVHPVAEIDFRFFWVAGKAWQAGINPYGPGFEQLGRRLLPPGNVTFFWFYPPQWWLVCRPLAWLSLAQAIAVWRFVGGLLLYAATALLVGTLVAGPALRRWGLIGIACGAVVAIEPTANLIAYGQSSALLYLGVSLIVTGLLTDRRWTIAVGLFLVLLKPQVGAPLLLPLLLLPRTWPAIAAAIAATLLAAIPQFATFGVLPTVHQFLGNAHAYGGALANGAIMFSGPMQLVARLVPVAIDAKVQILIALPLMAGAVLLLRRGTLDPVLAMLVFSSALIAFVPLHGYDLSLILLPCFLALAAGLPWPPIALAAALAIRPGKLDALLGIPIYGDGISAGLIWLTISTLILFGLAIAAARRGRAS